MMDLSPAAKRLGIARAIVAPLGVVLLLLSAFGGLWLPALRAEPARVIPPPATDESLSPAASSSEVAVLAGGCFWGVQGVFQHVAGISSAVSGYAGGNARTAEYETVSSGETGHAESVKITFDPKQISFGRILQIYFSVAHDPTQLNRQGPDYGTQYRSAIFAQSAEQAAIGRQYIEQLTAAHAFDSAIVTRIELNKAFYPAEAYHQDFLALNPTNPYIARNDLPKVSNLQRLFPELYRANPTLVSARR
jgi:peptide-methionine (S)-S-oxide reductase